MDKELHLNKHVTGAVLAKCGFIPHKVEDRGMIRYENKGRIHALYHDGCWHLHWDRTESLKHQKYRYVYPSARRALIVAKRQLEATVI